MAQNHASSPLFNKSQPRLLGFDVLGAGPFRSLPDGKAYALTFAQIVIPGTLTGRLMEEVFRAVAGRNKSKTLVGQPLDRSACVIRHVLSASS